MKTRVQQQRQPEQKNKPDENEGAAATAEVEDEAEENEGAAATAVGTKEQTTGATDENEGGAATVASRTKFPAKKFIMSKNNNESKSVAASKPAGTFSSS